MARALRSDKCVELLADWAAFVDGLVDSPADERPDAERPIGELAGARIATVYRRMVKGGRTIDDDGPAEALHDLRKQGKELRYLLEFFGALYPDEDRAADAEDAQGAAGHRSAASRTPRCRPRCCRDHRDTVAGREGGAAALMAMGVLVDRLESEKVGRPRALRRALRGLRGSAAARARGGHVRVTPVLATYNIKGGVGKTSAAVNLAYLAAREDAPRMLLWDLDPQGASTYLFRIKPKVKGGGRKLVRGKSEVESLIKGTDHDRLDLLPADFSYRHMDLALDDTKKPTRRLSKVLAPLAGDYDYVFLDCPPSISLVSESVFEAADALLVPLIPATLSSRTFAQLQAGALGGRARRCWRSSRCSTAASACTAR